MPVIQPHVGPRYYSLGKSERPDLWCFRLRTQRHCLVDLDEAGRIQTVRWLLLPEALSADFVRLFDDPENFPFWLFRLDTVPILVQSPSSLLLGAEGAAIKSNTGEVLWVPAEHIIGVAVHLIDEPLNDIAPPPAVAKAKDAERQ